MGRNIKVTKARHWANRSVGDALKNHEDSMVYLSLKASCSHFIMATRKLKHFLKQSTIAALLFWSEDAFLFPSIFLTLFLVLVIIFMCILTVITLRFHSMDRAVLMH